MAIVTFVAKTGLNLVERTDTKIVLSGPNHLLLHFEILFVFPFSSENKRMGCIVRYCSYSYQLSLHHISEEKFFFFLKGAENVILPFLTIGDSDWLQVQLFFPTYEVTFGYFFRKNAIILLVLVLER
jgi:phospholipid-translocating ATPase